MSHITFENGDVVVEAETIAEGLSLTAPQVAELMRTGAITSRCERGVGPDKGLWRLTFLHGKRRLQLIVSTNGEIVQRSDSEVREDQQR